jgi:glucokinase
MTNFSLVGDIGGTNSRFGLVEQGSMVVQQVDAQKNDNFPSLEASVTHYLKQRGVTALHSAAVAVAAPVDRDVITLTNRDWTFSANSLREATNAQQFRLLNDFEALAYSLPHIAEEDLVQIGGIKSEIPHTKIVLGPGTGLGMSILAPLKPKGWMALPCEPGHITLPIESQAEYDWRDLMREPGEIFTTEQAISGGGFYLMYKTIAPSGKLSTPEAVMQAALAGSDVDAVKVLDQFIVWLARIAGDAAMILQARGGVYLAGGIAPTLIDQLKRGKFRSVFENKGKMSHVMTPIPIYIITDRFPAFKGCAAALPA